MTTLHSASRPTMAPETGPVTQLLETAAAGDQEAMSGVLSAVYEDLRSMAQSRVGGPHSLRPTDLVHEAYLKLVNAGDRTWSDRRHFINSAGTAMRSIIVDRARSKATAKKGAGREREPLHADAAVFDRDPAEILAIHEALDGLAEVDSRAARVVELRVFLGLSETEIADTLGVTDRTVQRDWRFARAWLAQTMMRTRV